MRRKKVVKNPRTKRTRNGETWTESEFFAKIRSSLRNISRFWIPAKLAKEMARRAYKGINKRQKWEYKCNHCNNWFSEKNIQADHIEEAGTLKSFDDLKGFCERLFCEISGYQILCTSCHNIKTKEYIKNKKGEINGKK